MLAFPVAGGFPLPKECTTLMHPSASFASSCSLHPGTLREPPAYLIPESISILVSRGQKVLPLYFLPSYHLRWKHRISLRSFNLGHTDSSLLWLQLEIEAPHFIEWSCCPEEYIHEGPWTLGKQRFLLFLISSWWDSILAWGLAATLPLDGLKWSYNLLIISSFQPKPTWVSSVSCSQTTPNCES